MGEIIRQATIDDKESIILFLSKYWSANHVLTKSEELFDFFYFDSFSKNLNFFLGFENTKLTGLQGFIPLCQFFSTNTPPLNIENNSVTCLSLWKVIDSASNGQGLRLIRKIEDSFSDSTIIATGYHDSVEPIYKRLGYKTGVLNHYTVLHPEIKKFDAVFGSLPDEKFNIQVGLKSVHLNKLKNTNDIQEYLINLSVNEKIDSFVKPPEYYVKRFIEFKWYNYEFFQITSQKKDSLGFLICRIADSPFGRVLRILDIIAKDYTLNLYGPIKDFLVDQDLIYADFFDNLDVENCREPFGLIKLSDHQNLPNLFEPFSVKRKNIRVAIRTKTSNVFPYITRSDGDQDRPSQLK
jgi:hypothetical protein